MTDTLVANNKSERISLISFFGCVTGNEPAMVKLFKIALLDGFHYANDLRLSVVYLLVQFAQFALRKRNALIALLNDGARLKSRQVQLSLIKRDH